MSAHSVAFLQAGARRRQQVTQDDHLPTWTLPKRLEAYLAAEGVPLEAEGIYGFLSTEWDRTIIIDTVGNVRVRSASSISFHLWYWLGFEVLATIPEMPRHTPVPG